MSTDPYNPDPLAAALARATAAEAQANTTPAEAADPAPAAANDAEPQSPDQLMQAASARIAELEAEVADLRDRWMRSEAEIQNVRTRARREVDDARQYAIQGFARDVAEAAENLKRGLDSIPPGCATASPASSAVSSGCWSATASKPLIRPGRCSIRTCIKR
jgi:molecular chaperone GrpE (heat shock protein)